MNPIFHILVLCCSFGAITAQVCPPIEGAPYCVCQTSDGGIIDLTSLSQEGSPRFQNIQDPQGQKYSYNPCYGIESDLQCSENGQISAVCQEDTQGSVRSCGQTSTAEFRIESGGSRMVIQYNGGTDGRISLVNLVCDPNLDEPRLTALGDFGTPLTYSFELRTKCACKDGCQRANRGSGKGSGNKSGPIGIALIVLFVCAWPTYFIAGAFILRFRFDKTGLELIPQRSFWIALPGLIKDGCIFTFNPIIQLIKQKTGSGGGTGTTEKNSLIP